MSPISGFCAEQELLPLTRRTKKQRVDLPVIPGTDRPGSVVYRQPFRETSSFLVLIDKALKFLQIFCRVYNGKILGEHRIRYAGKAATDKPELP
jgi:hypothetical protein